jgi:GTPase SAR1 family protein
MVVYDITDLESFNNINSWLIEIEKNANKNVYKILIGNKCDLEEKRQVSYEQGKEFADTYGMKFIETSAKTNHNVQEAYVTMTKEIISQAQEKEKAVSKNEEKKEKKNIELSKKSLGKDIGGKNGYVFININLDAASKNRYDYIIYHLKSNIIRMIFL